MAVFTKVSEKAFREFAAGYRLRPPLRLEPILEGIENTNYRVASADGRFVLTLLEGRSRKTNPHNLTRILADLHKRGLPVPEPVPNREGSLVGALSGRPAILVTLLPGSPVESPGCLECNKAGRALARLHLAGQEVSESAGNLFGIDTWRSYFESFSEKIDLDEPIDSAAIKDEIRYLEVNWPTDLASGLIHADYFPDNVLFSSGEVTGVLDYYFACTDLLAYDLAIAVSAWCGSEGEWPRRDLLVDFVDGYEAVRPLDDAEKAAMPLLLRGACIRFLLTRLHDWRTTPNDAMVKKKDPREYLVKLEAARRIKDWLE